MNASTTGTAGSRPDFSSPKDSANDALNRGKESIANAASSLASNASYDLDGLRKDLNSLKDTVSKFVSQAGDVSSSVATKVGNAASSLAESGSDIASAATDQAKSFASELPLAVRNLFHRAAAPAQPNALIPHRPINQLLSGVRIWFSRFWCCLAPTCVSRLPATLQSTIS